MGLRTDLRSHSPKSVATYCTPQISEWGQRDWILTVPSMFLSCIQRVIGSPEIKCQLSTEFSHVHITDTTHNPLSLTWFSYIYIHIQICSVLNSKTILYRYKLNKIYFNRRTQWRTVHHRSTFTSVTWLSGTVENTVGFLALHENL